MCKPPHPFRTIPRGTLDVRPPLPAPSGRGEGTVPALLAYICGPAQPRSVPSPASSVRAPAHPSAPRGPPDAGFRRRMGPNMYPAGWVPARPAQLSLRLDAKTNPHPTVGGCVLGSYVRGPAQGTLQAPPSPWNSIDGACMGRPRPTHTPRVPIRDRSREAPRQPGSRSIHLRSRAALSPNRRTALIATPPPMSRSSSRRSAAPSAIHGTPNVWIHRETTKAPGTAGDPAARLCAPWDPGRITYDAPPVAPSGTLDVRIPNVGRQRPPHRGRDPRRMNRRPPPLDLRRLSP